MRHSLIANYIHIVFSTKHREKSLTPEIRERLWKVMQGTLKKYDIPVIVIGGHDDHCHALISLPSTISLSEAAKLLKGYSSKWLSEEFPELKSFQWQKGYAAFSVSMSNIPKVLHYINNQEEHHKRSDFKDEFLGLLNKHQLSYSEKDVLE